MVRDEASGDRTFILEVMHAQCAGMAFEIQMTIGFRLQEADFNPLTCNSVESNSAGVSLHVNITRVLGMRPLNCTSTTFTPVLGPLVALPPSGIDMGLPGLPAAAERNLRQRCCFGFTPTSC